MNSPKTLKKTPIPNPDLATQLKRLDLWVTAQTLDDLLARALTQRSSPHQLLEEIARSETEDLARRAARSADALPLGPIRSLHYFLPVIEELLQTPLRHGDTYLAYLRSKVSLRPAANPPSSVADQSNKAGGGPESKAAIRTTPSAYRQDRLQKWVA
jgi:hypothetical protein